MALSAKAQRVLLRLDDGQMLGSAGILGVAGVSSDSATVLDIDAAFKAGRLPATLVQKLEGILHQFAEKVLGSSSYHLRTVNNVIREQAIETQRSIATPRANGHAYADPPESPAGTAIAESEWAVGEFEQTCVNLLRQELNPLFGAEIIYFNRPVDLKYVPDYYKVIKKDSARDLGTMTDKLQAHQYTSPQDFYDDMQLFFGNIILYNGSATPFGQLGERVRRVFERKWAATPFGPSTRTRRATAGIAPTKYEANDAPQPDKQAGGRPSSGKGGGGAGPAARPARAPKRAADGGGGGGRPTKQQKSAPAAAPRGPMPRARMQQLAQVLGELEGNELNGVLQIIRESADLPDNGEIELDFDTLSQDTLWQLDSYLQTINKGTGDGGTFSLVDSDDSEEFESDSDSD